MEDKVLISKREYAELTKRSEWLYYLEAAGIDNTDAYSFAQENAREDGFWDDEEDEDDDDV